MRELWVILALVLVLPACQAEAGGGRTVVASFYPLAFAAERLGGTDWEVIDLTPPGTEAHDVELSLEDRVAIEEADVVLYLGDVGFQPQVESALREAQGKVVVVGGPSLFSGPVTPPDLAKDPHIWLSPGGFQAIVLDVAGGLGAPAVAVRRDALIVDLRELALRYEDGLADCRFHTAIVSHEAFGYLLGAYGLRQFGLSGLEPEGEPAADRLREAERLIADGVAGAIFHEPTEEGLRVAENFAGDLGVPALPLSTLESRPAAGDYLSVMEDNLESLREGLQCR